MEVHTRRKSSPIFSYFGSESGASTSWTYQRQTKLKLSPIIDMKGSFDNNHIHSHSYKHESYVWVQENLREEENKIKRKDKRKEKTTENRKYS